MIRYFSTNSQSLRKSLHFFFKLVHPDLSSSSHQLSRDSNEASLATLNAYIDSLESPMDDSGSAVCLNETTLQFFKPYTTATGMQLTHKMQPISLTLPPLRSSATFLEKIAIRNRILEDAKTASTANGFSILSASAPILTPKNSTQESLTKLWQEEVEEEIMMGSVYPQLGNDKSQEMLKKKERREAEFERYVQSRLSNATRGKDERRIQKRVDKLHKTATERVNRIIGAPAPPNSPEFEEEMQAEADHKQTLRLRVMGFHPDLVGMHTSLTPAEKKLASDRLTGRHLSTKAEVWLLRNIWKTLAETPIPIVVMKSSSSRPTHSPSAKHDASTTNKVEHPPCSLPLVPDQAELPTSLLERLKKWEGTGHSIDTRLGFLHVPLDFDVWKLADFLEEVLDDLKEIRMAAVDRFQSLYGGS